MYLKPTSGFQISTLIFGFGGDPHVIFIETPSTIVFQISKLIFDIFLWA
jgi:hypothetical protein